MFSQLGFLAARDGRIGRRRPLAAAGRWAVVPGSTAVVVASIASTSFDGGQDGAFKEILETVVGWVEGLGTSILTAERLTDTVFLLLFFAGVGLIFWLGLRGMRTVPGAPSLPKLRTAFAHTLIPIALAYLVAHYFSLFVFQEQAQFTYLLSDPLGNGSNYFGTVTSSIDYSVLSSTGVWYVQVAALVTGHVTGLILAHDRALAIYGDSKRASLSQRWMLLVMVGFTCLGLFLLSQSNG